MQMQSYSQETMMQWTSGENFNIQGKMIKSEETVKLLGIQLDYRLNFEQHISELCCLCLSTQCLEKTQSLY